MHAGCPSTTIKVAASVHVAKKTTGFLVHLRCAVVHQECHSILAEMAHQPPYRTGVLFLPSMA